MGRPGYSEEDDGGALSSLCTSASNSQLPTPVGTPTGHRRRAPAVVPPPTLCRRRVHEVPKERPVDQRKQLMQLATVTPFRIQDKADASAAAANTPKAWELTKDFDSGPGWQFRSMKSAERLGLTR